MGSSTDGTMTFPSRRIAAASSASLSIVSYCVGCEVGWDPACDEACDAACVEGIGSCWMSCGSE